MTEALLKGLWKAAKPVAAACDAPTAFEQMLKELEGGTDCS